MTAQNRFDDFGVTSSRSKAWISLCETNWGYIIRSDTGIANRAALIERTCAVAGIAFLTAAFGQWMIPQVQAAVVLAAPERVVSTLGLAMPGLMFLWISSRGMTREVQVDEVKRCLRMSVCNRNGRSRVLRSVPFEQIGSAFIKRGAPAALYLRFADEKRVLRVASGRETTLRLLHERLSHQFRPVRTQVDGWERKGRRLQPAVA